MNPAPRGRVPGSSLSCGIGGRSLVFCGLFRVIPDERVEASDGPEVVRPGILRLQLSGAEMVVFALEPVVEGARESVSGLC